MNCIKGRTHNSSEVPTLDSPALGIYVQVPFCASKCSFCNFSSGVERSSLYDRYVAGILRELASWDELVSGYAVSRHILAQTVDSIYIGGGTPTLLGAHRLGLLIAALQEGRSWSEDVEFTLETTPGSAHTGLVNSLRALGVNRLSIGAQTFDDRELRAVGRLHSAEQTIELLHSARRAGFQNLSLDLIAGLPFQTADSFRRSLEAVATLRPEHVSLYLLEVDEKSRLGKEVMRGGNQYHAETVPDDGFMADAYESGCEFLTGEGYFQYEISNFALPGFESRHNRKYWQLAPYVGLGAGAHSFDGEHRWANQTKVERYLAELEAGHSPIEDIRTLSSAERLEEFFFLGLRQAEGIDLTGARGLWGEDCLRPWEEKIRSLAQDGLLMLEGRRARLSPRAYLISNEIFQEFVNV